MPNSTMSRTQTMPHSAQARRAVATTESLLASKLRYAAE